MDTLVVIRIAVASLLGVCTGSFLNVVIYRLPRRESIARPPSACPNCATPLARRDLVPVLSWVVLRAKCRSSATPISARYPFIELLTAVVFGLLAWRFEELIQLSAFLVLGASCVALSAIDFDTKTLPTRLVYFTLIVGAVLLGIAAIVNNEPSHALNAAISSAAVATLFFVTWYIAPRGIGFGDVRFSAALALFMGWLGFGHVFVGITLAFLLGAVAGLALMVFGRAGRKSSIPFGPFLAIGALIAILVGQPIISWWLPSA